MNCTFASTGKKGDTCKRCGTILKTDMRPPLFYPCKGKIASRNRSMLQPALARNPIRPVVPLGDRIEAALKRVGINEDGYKAIKAMFGLPEDCGCSGRKEWLNKVSDWWRNL